MFWASVGVLLTGASDLSAVLAKLREPKTLRAHFVQTKESPAFSSPRVVEGQVIFARPRRLRWMTERPFSTSLVLDGDRVTMRMSELDRERRIDLAAHPEMKAVFDTLLFFAEADVRGLEGRFLVRLKEGEGGSAVGRKLVLTPVSDGLKKLISEIRVELAASGRHLEKVELLQHDGAKTSWHFVDVKLDGPVEASVFDE